MAANARMRRLESDYEQIKKEFTGHKNIIVTPVGTEPPEKYHVTYFVNGIYLLPDGKVEVLGRHEVDITLHSDYPRYKPICTISTPIWHPNFKDGQICIGDIWGAGESLADIIINIGDMIQYKSWNSFSPLSADAAQWAIENKHLFPIGSTELNVADYSLAKDSVDIDLFDENGETISEVPAEEEKTDTELSKDIAALEPVETKTDDGNDFEITAEELEGVEFIPSAQRMQSVPHGGTVKGGGINIKTVLLKGILWAFIGAVVGFAITEVFEISSQQVANLMGYSYMGQYFGYDEKADEYFEKVYDYYEDYCETNGLDVDDSDNFSAWYDSDDADEAATYISKYTEYYQEATNALYSSYQYEFGEDEDALISGMKRISTTSTALWSAALAMFLGLALGIGEGVFYGSTEGALKYGAIGAGVSVVMGFISGYIAQTMYGSFISDASSDFASSLIRGFGWMIMGIGVGAAIGLIKPAGKRILYCILGGGAGAFIGGFLFNYIMKLVPDDIIARGIAILIMGILIGIGVGVLEQMAKQAWLKVVRGAFEGKEYLVFTGTTSIGNNGKNTIVLFKDKLVGPHHCDIILEGNKYSIVDCGTPMGTVVNGMRIQKYTLKQGDTISIGNSVLIFNTK